MRSNKRLSKKVVELVNSEQWERAASKVVPILRKNIFDISTPKIIKQSHEEEAVLLLSDIHTGMINRHPLTGEVTYNDEIRSKEYVYLRDSISSVKGLLDKSFNMRNLHIFCLGDIVTNDRIFEGQKFEISCGIGEQIWVAVRDLTNFIGEMKKLFITVHFEGVIGNHGRTFPDYQTEPVQNNFEYHLYRILQMVFANDKRVKITVPETATHSVDIRGHKYYMSHGNNIRGLSRNALERSVKDILVALPEGFDIYTIGHLHRCENMDLNENSMLLINGCWIKADCFGYEVFKQFSNPRQWFFGVSDKRPITWWYRLGLQAPEKK